MKKLLLPLIFLIYSCSPDESCEPTPILSTENAINITDTSATVSGTINPPTCDEVSSISSQGFVYSRYPQPEIDQDSVVEISGVSITHTFSFNQNSTYYVRTFLENNTGVYYGNEIEINTTVGNLIISTGNFFRVKSTSFSIRTNGIDDLGGGVLKRFGVCWSTNQNPTIQDNFKDVPERYNGYKFDAEIDNLQKNTPVYVRAFGENEAGVFYGDEKLVNTSIGYTDHEGNFYETVKLENITFTAKNLSTSYFSNGDEILKVNNLAEAEEAFKNETPAWCYYNFDDTKSNRGKLYNYFVINDSRSIGFDDWKVPTDDEMIMSFDKVAGHHNPKYGEWGGNNADVLKLGGNSGFDAFETNLHSEGLVNVANNFIMWTSSTYKDPRYTEPYKLTRVLKFDNSINRNKT